MDHTVDELTLFPSSHTSSSSCPPRPKRCSRIVWTRSTGKSTTCSKRTMPSMRVTMHTERRTQRLPTSTSPGSSPRHPGRLSTSLSPLFPALSWHSTPPSSSPPQAWLSPPQVKSPGGCGRWRLCLWRVLLLWGALDDGEDEYFPGPASDQKDAASSNQGAEDEYPTSDQKQEADFASSKYSTKLRLWCY